MTVIWKLMGYTQGENDQNLNMKLIMPIFVGAETLENEYKGIETNILKLDYCKPWI